MNLREWDRDVAPYLHSIEYNARQVGSFTRSVMSVVSLLKARPTWETRAEFELAAAERELEAALLAIRHAREEYANKPVIVEAA
jgi:hypothetical protein